MREGGHFVISLVNGLIQDAPFVTELLQQPTHARRQAEGRVAKHLREPVDQDAASHGECHRAPDKTRAVD
jgi:hypothetical protein